MKKLIRFALVLIVIAIFAFSNNPTITKGRTATVEFGKDLFSKGDTLYQEIESDILK